jgi:hypothetical protein
MLASYLRNYATLGKIFPKKALAYFYSNDDSSKFKEPSPIFQK